jgi:hypothetical protein
LADCVRPLVAPTLLFTSALWWACASPGDVLAHDPRAFFWAMGVVFSNIAVSTFFFDF